MFGKNWKRLFILIVTVLAMGCLTDLSQAETGAHRGGSSTPTSAR